MATPFQFERIDDAEPDVKELTQFRIRYMTGHR
jgi:hypothetical protein